MDGSINFDNPSSILYSWKLEGFYDQWTPPTSNGTIRYTNLSPETIRWRYAPFCSTTSRYWKKGEIQILVERPFWLTFWAFLIYALFIIGAAYAFLRYQIIKRERKTSEEKSISSRMPRTTYALTDHDQGSSGEIMEKESLSENGQKNIQLAIQSTETWLNWPITWLISRRKNYILTDHRDGARTESLSEQLYASVWWFCSSKGHFHESSFDSLDVGLIRARWIPFCATCFPMPLKYTPQGGRVSSKAESNKNTWTLFLSDTGIGMNKEDQKKALQIFIQRI